MSVHEILENLKEDIAEIKDNIKDKSKGYKFYLSRNEIVGFIFVCLFVLIASIYIPLSVVESNFIDSFTQIHIWGKVLMGVGVFILGLILLGVWLIRKKE